VAISLVSLSFGLALLKEKRENTEELVAVKGKAKSELKKRCRMQHVPLIWLHCDITFIYLSL